MEFISREDLFDRYPKKMLYVGFLRSGDTWFPLSSVSDPENAHKLDTLFVSPFYPVMDELVKGYADQIPEVKEHFIHLLMHDEISNVMESFGLQRVGLAVVDGGGSECACGCGCS